jgi:hypothetical protein
MQPWTDWPLERLMYLFLSAAYLLVWVQVILFHWRGGFRHLAMWGPVLYTPLLVVVALLMGFLRGGILETAFGWIYAIGLIEGLGGMALHARGVATMIGGINLRNLMGGPPVILPTMYAALSGLGLLVFYWPEITGAS